MRRVAHPIHHAQGGSGQTASERVVLHHQRPRDTPGFDWWAQALASQGYAVLQPNFRGSGGYGKAFAELGKRQWGERMQEDVEDAVAQVVVTTARKAMILTS